MISTIDPEMKLEEVLELFARVQNKGRKVTPDDIETMWVTPKWSEARSSIHDMIERWQDTSLQKVVTKPNIVRVVGILLNGRQHRHDLSLVNPSTKQLKRAFAEANEYFGVIGAAMERQLGVRSKNTLRTVVPVSVLAHCPLTTTLRGYHGGSSAGSVNQELDALNAENPWRERRNISDARHGPSLTEPTRFDYQTRAPNPHHILVQALRMRPTCHDWVTGLPLRDIDPSEMV